jgi:hypothetical protein
MMQIGLAVAYSVTGGKSLQVIEEISRGCTYSAEDIDVTVGDVGKVCDVNLTKWIFVFALFQVFLSQIPSFHGLWCGLVPCLLALWGA